MTSKRERAREAKKTAMPHVKALVRNHGLATVASCIASLRELGKQSKKLAGLKKEVARIERQLTE